MKHIIRPSAALRFIKDTSGVCSRQADTGKQHKESKTRKNVVVTHHAPSRKSVHDLFLKHTISAAFAYDMEDFIQATPPDVWIHGHIHLAADYRIGRTRVICNPVGYPEEKKTGYTGRLVIEVWRTCRSPRLQDRKQTSNY